MAVAALAVGTAVSVYGQVSASEERARAERDEAALIDRQSKEIISRATVQERQILREGEEFKGQQVVSMAALNIDVGGQSPLAMLADTDYKIKEDIRNMREEATFRARQLGASAAAQRSSADITARSGYYSAGSTLLTNAYLMDRASGTGNSKEKGA